MIAIHNGIGGFHPLWRTYCDENKIDYKEVDCYASDIIQQLHGCDMLFWHFSQSDPRDIILAKSIVCALYHAGIKMFPDFNTSWHFDNKVAQKYLLDALEIEYVPSYVFVRKQNATAWVENVTFPKVFKLKGGAGSANVKLIKTKDEARKVINKAFSTGIMPFDGFGNFVDVLDKFRAGRQSFKALLKAIYRVFVSPEFVKVMGKEYGYVYFQEFIPDNNSDFRVIVIGDKAFAIKRGVRENDFRASGSGFIEYSKNLFDDLLIQKSFDIASKLETQCIALDFLIDKAKNYLLVEFSYGFAPHGYYDCEGYWDRDLNWYPGKINPYGWMIDLASK